MVKNSKFSNKYALKIIRFYNYKKLLHVKKSRFLFKFISLLIMFLILNMNLYSQVAKLVAFRESFNTGLLYIDTHKPYKALETFIQLKTVKKEDILYNTDPKYEENLKSFKHLQEMIDYHIAEAYLNTHEKTKAIPYIETYISNPDNAVNPNMYKVIGTLYHLNYEFYKAINSFKKYLYITNENGEYTDYCNRMIKICENGLYNIDEFDPLDLNVENLGITINSEDSESNPFISADDSILYYTSIRYFNKNNKTDSVKQIRVSYKDNGYWNKPEIVEVPEIKGNISLAGLSPDGKQLFFAIAYGTNTDLYLGHISNNKCSKLLKLPDKINTMYSERSASITPDGLEMYFSSNRPGGYGGYDIYKVVLDNNGNWNEPINLGAAINTAFDEDAPFIHPNKKLLYFSSKGHNTIGGFDIFKTELDNNKKWSDVKNIGIPVNNTEDNIYFTLSASGQNGYFSVAKDEKMKNRDIYSISYKENIPLTLLKGTIYGGNKPVSANIRVIDKDTEKEIHYVYNPAPLTGEYFMILPPGKHYDIIFEAKGYIPQLISIYIPNQTYFYVLFQNIQLKNTDILSRAKSQEIMVLNSFYDCFSSRNKDYSQLTNLMQRIVNSTDNSFENKGELQDLTPGQNFAVNATLGNMISNALQKPNSAIANIVSETTNYNDLYTSSYFYASKINRSKLHLTIIGNDSIYTAPPIWAVNNDPHPIFKNMYKKKQATLTTPNTNYMKDLIFTYPLYFDKNSSEIRRKYNDALQQIADLLIDNKRSIKIEIDAYSNSAENRDPNSTLQKNRANAIIRHLQNLQAPVEATPEDIKSFWEVGDSDKQDEREFRKVDIKVFQLLEATKI